MHRLFSILTMAVLSFAIATGCGSSPGVPASTSDNKAPDRLIPPGPGGALAEIQLAETTAAMPVKLSAARGFVESVGTDGKTRLTVDVSDFPVNNTRLSITLLQAGGRYFIERCSLMVTGDDGRENWEIDPAFAGNATVHVDKQGRWHLKFGGVALTSDAWPQAATLTGTLVAYR